MNTYRTMPQKVEAYLTERRQAGYALRVIGSQLKSFARFAEDLGHRGPLTLDLALGWAQASQRARPATAAGRLAQLRPFAQFCHRLDPASAIPPAQFFGRSYRHLTPHIYSPEEIRALLAAAEKWPPAGCLRAESYTTLFGLLAATGLRLSEALTLERRDVDLKQGLLHIRETKFYKSRYVPLHATTLRALQRYASRRDRAVPRATTAKFFLADQGCPLRLRAVQYAFEQLREKLGWHSRGGHPARASTICGRRHHRHRAVARARESRHDSHVRRGGYPDETARTEDASRAKEYHRALPATGSPASLPAELVIIDTSLRTLMIATRPGRSSSHSEITGATASAYSCASGRRRTQTFHSREVTLRLMEWTP